MSNQLHDAFKKFYSKPDFFKKLKNEYKAHGIDEAKYDWADIDNADDKSTEEIVAEVVKDKILPWVSNAEEKNGKICLWRCIKLKNLEDLNKEKLGVYWTYNERNAECYYGKSGEDYAVGGLVNLSGIDIPASALLHLEPNGGGMEQEIRLLAGKEIDVFTVKKKGKEVENFKSFKATASAKYRVVAVSLKSRV